MTTARWYNTNSTVWTGVRYLRDREGTVELSLTKSPMLIKEGKKDSQVFFEMYEDSNYIDLNENDTLLCEGGYHYLMLGDTEGTLADFEKFSQFPEIIQRGKFSPKLGKVEDYRWWILWKTTTVDFYSNISSVLENAKVALEKSGVKKVKILDHSKEFQRRINTVDHYNYVWTAYTIQRIVQTNGEGESFDPLPLLIGKSKNIEEISIAARLLSYCIRFDKKKDMILDKIHGHIMDQFPLIESFSETLDFEENKDRLNLILCIIGFIFHLLFWDALPRKQHVITKLLDTFTDKSKDVQTCFLWLTQTLMVLSGNAPGKWKKIVSGVDQYYRHVLESDVPEKYMTDKNGKPDPNAANKYQPAFEEVMDYHQRWQSFERNIHAMIIERIEKLLVDHEMSSYCCSLYEKAIAVIDKPTIVPRSIPNGEVEESSMMINIRRLVQPAAAAPSRVVEEGGMLIISAKKKPPPRAPTSAPIPIPAPDPVPAPASYASAVSGTKTTRDAGTMTSLLPKSYIPKSTLNRRSSLLMMANLDDMFD